MQHNKLLHIPQQQEQNNHTGSSPHLPQQPSSTLKTYHTREDGNNGQQSRVGNTANTRSYVTQRADYISLMVLPAIIKNGERELKVNVMLDPCSTGSYVTEAAAEEQQLNGEMYDLTVS